MYGFRIKSYHCVFTFQIQGTAESSQNFATPLEHFEAMYSEGMPEFVVDQGLYYPTTTNYGYICTGKYILLY